MRTVLNLNSKWAFTKMLAEVPTAYDSKWNFVNLPHCWILCETYYRFLRDNSARPKRSFE